jgi:hypothetical protein
MKMKHLNFEGEVETVSHAPGGRSIGLEQTFAGIGLLGQADFPEGLGSGNAKNTRTRLFKAWFFLFRAKDFSCSA